MIGRLFSSYAGCSKGVVMKNTACGFRSLFVMCMLFMCSVFVDAQNQEPVKLYGSIRYSSAPEGFDWGVYSWNASEPVEFTPEFISGDLMASGGAVYAFGKYYIVSYLEFGGMYIGMLLTCDIETQTYDYVDIEEFDVSYVTSDMTFDSQSGKIYACSLDKDGSGNTNLSIFSTSDGSQSVIAPMPTMCALAAAADGTLYGIGLADGILYTIDKATAQLTEVGSTGVKPEKIQTATIDQRTGIMYWSAYTSEGGALYTVNLTTGVATLVSKYPNGEQMSGMFIMEEETSSIPDAPVDFVVSFDKASLEGKAAMKLPLNGVDGNPLSGNLKYTVLVDNVQVAEGEGQPGEEVFAPVSVTDAGEHLFSAQVGNAGGIGPACNMKLYVGMDIPIIEDIKVGSASGDVTLSWKILETGVHGGYVDTAIVMYKIVRLPDDVLVAEAYSDTVFVDIINPESMRIAFYKVTPVIEGVGVGETIESAYVRVGEELSIPFSHNFFLWPEYALYSIVDVNDDYCTWTYDNYLQRTRLDWPFGDSSDDWIITPPIKLEKDKKYQAFCTVCSEVEGYSANVEIKLGKGNTVEELVQPILAGTEIDFIDARELQSDHFTVEEDGVYYLGIHGYGSKSHFYLYINSLAVKEIITTELSSVGNKNSIGVVVNENIVCVENPAEIPYCIYNASGVEIAAEADRTFTVTLAPGVYILRSADTCMKFSIVR